MEYRRIGRSGLKVSVIGLGSGSPTYAGRSSEDDAIAIIDRAFDLGITFFDTAETYAEGRAERLLGKALKTKRSEVVIATKFGKDRSVGPSEQRGSRSRILKAVDGSLGRLECDYIDLYVLHEADPETPIEETLGALDDLVRWGKVRYIGCSDLRAWQLADALAASKLGGWESFITAGAPYNLLDRACEVELLPCCEAHGVGFTPTMPLAQGFLTGKYRRDQPLPQDARFTSPAPFAAALRQDLGHFREALTPERFGLLEELEGITRTSGRRLIDVALGWLLANPLVGVVPVGVSRLEQVETITASGELKLEPDELAAVSAALARCESASTSR